MASWIYNLNRLLTIFLRNNVIDPGGRGAWKSDIYIADGLTNSFDTTEVGVNAVQFIKIRGIEYVHLKDYEINYGNSGLPATLNMLVTPKNGDTVEIRYHYGQTWIYPGFPRLDATFPRIGYKVIDDFQEEIAIGRFLQPIRRTHADELSGTGTDTFELASTPVTKLLRVQHPRGVYLDVKNREFRQSGNFVVFATPPSTPTDATPNVVVDYTSTDYTGMVIGERHNMQIQFEIWATTTLERDQIVDQILSKLMIYKAQFRSIGVLDIKLIGMFDSDYDADVRGFRKILDYMFIIDTTEELIYDRVIEEVFTEFTVVA